MIHLRHSLGIAFLVCAGIAAALTVMFIILFIGSHAYALLRDLVQN